MENASEATFRNATISFGRSLSSKLSVNLRLGWDEREGEIGADLIGDFGRTSEAWRARLGFNRRVGNNTTFNVAYEYTSQESDFALNDYDENRVTFNVRHAF